MSEEQIAELSEATGLGEEALQDMEDDSLESLAENVLEEKPSEGGDGQAENADETDTDEPPEWAENIMDRLDKLEESAEPAINEMQQKRNRLVSEVAQNSSFEEEELQGRSVEELEKLRSLAKNETYTGRGGPKGGGGDEIPEYIEPPSVFTDQDEE